MVDFVNRELAAVDADGVDVTFGGRAERWRNGRRRTSRQPFQFGRAAAVSIEFFRESHFAARNVAGYRYGIYMANERVDLRSLVGGEAQISVAADI